jgi:hypothetical protein
LNLLEGGMSTNESVRHFLVLCLAIAASPIALASSPRVFELPDHGALTLLVPDGWVAELKQPPNRLPPTITLKPRAGTQFVVLVTTVWPVGPSAKVPDEATIRSEVAGAAKGAASQSVEGVLPLQDIKGVDGQGFYFAATDKAPNPGEYKYLTQGILRVGEIGLAFTILTNDGQEAIVRAALDMLRAAGHRPTSAV